MRLKLVMNFAVLVVWLGPLHAAVVENNTTQKTFAYFGGSGRKLIIDNVNGSIDVTGYNGTEVQVTVDERWRAESSEKMQEARRDVKLDMGQQGNTVRLYVDGPFRCKGDCGDRRWHHDYDVEFNFHVKVPLDAALELKSVNGGHVKAENTSGDFNIGNVNGGIELQDIAGSGEVHTVNGSVKITFRENPRSPSSFKSVNGELAVTFPSSLSADFRCKTLNGGIYTDFEVNSLPGQVPVAEKQGTKYVYRTNGVTGIRIGAGGPEHRFETVNGSIRIIKRG